MAEITIMITFTTCTSAVLNFKLYLTAIAFKQDELCFHVLFCCQKSSESGQTAIMSCKNRHNFYNKKILEKACLLFYNFKSVGSSIRVPMFLVDQQFWEYTHTANLITVTLHSAYAGKGYHNSNLCSQSLPSNTDYNYII